MPNQTSWALNVKDAPYNAAGDGVADDTNPIKNAIADAASTGVRAVLLPAGTYRITSTIVMPSNMCVLGIEGQTTITYDGADGGYLFHFNAAQSNCHFSKLILTSSTAAGHRASAGVFIGAACADITIRECELSQFVDYAIRCSTPSERVIIEDNHVHHTGTSPTGSGINPSFLSHSRVARNLLRSCGNETPGQWAIYASGPVVSTAIDENIVQDCTGGIKVSTSDGHANVSISNNVLDRVTTGGIVFGHVRGLRVTGNSIRQCGAAILCDSVTNDLVVSGNTIDFNGTAGLGQIAMSFGSDDCYDGVVSGNMLLGLQGAGRSTTGMSFTKAHGVVVADNTFKSFDQPVLVTSTAAENITLANNTFYDSGNATAVQIGTGSSKIHLIGNQYLNGGGWLFDLTGSTDIVIEGNVKRTGSSLGRAAGCTNVTVVRNEHAASTPLASGTTGNTNLWVDANRRYGQSPYSSTASATYTVDNEELLNVDATSTNVAVTLPDAVRGNRRVTIKRIDASGNTVTVSPPSGTIDGAASQSLSQWQTLRCVSDGMSWFLA